MQITVTMSEEEYDEYRDARRCKKLMDGAIPNLKRQLKEANETLLKKPELNNRIYGFIDGVNYALKLLGY